jgi:hypothetical protein
MRRFIIIAGSLVLAVFAFAACGGDGDGGAATPTAQPTRPATPIRTPPPRRTPAVDIREIDLEALPEVQAAIEETGGLFVQTDVTYADLTGDGFDEAIAPIASGGTLGNLGFFVVTVNGTEPDVLLSEFPTESGGVAVSIEDGKLVMTQPVYGPDDPECCPSSLRRTTYAWNGTALAVEDVRTEPNPAAGGGGVTPGAGQ